MGSPRVIDAHAIPSPEKGELKGDLQLELLNDLALPAALSKQRQRCHLLLCRESLGDAKEGYSFCFNGWGLVWPLLALSRRHKPLPALHRSTAPPRPLKSKNKKQKKYLKIKTKSVFPHVV